jgi:hypothetical protein
VFGRGKRGRGRLTLNPNHDWMRLQTTQRGTGKKGTYSEGSVMQPLLFEWAGLVKEKINP